MTSDTVAAPRRTPYHLHQSALSGAGMVLHAAAAAELPSPWIVDPTIWRTTLQFDPEQGWDDFTAWATWLDAEPVFEDWADQGVQRWAVSAVLFDVQLRLVVRKRVALQCPDCGHVEARHSIVGCADCRTCFHPATTVAVLAERQLSREARQAVTV